MYTVKEILRDKGSLYFSVSSRESVFNALKLMAEKNVGSLLVMDEEKLVGILSERDYARKIILQSKSSRETPVGDLMTREMFYVSPDDTIEECMTLMTDRRVRHLPVLENNQVAGIISIGDVVKHIISEQQFTIQQLKKFISGDM